MAGSFSYFCGDYAPSIGHAPKPLHLMYIERREESDGEEGGQEERVGGLKGEGHPPYSLTWGFLVKLCSSRAHMSASP